MKLTWSSQGFRQIINQQTLTNWENMADGWPKQMTRVKQLLLFTASSSLSSCEWLCITSEEPPSCCFGPFFFFPAACHVDGICGKKRWTATWIYQARHSCRKHPSAGQHCFLFIKKKKCLTTHFVSDELFSTLEKDNMCLQEAGGQTVSNGHLAERSNSNGSVIMSFMSEKM